MSRSRPLLVELLEERNVLTTFGVPWPDADNLRLSFVPDGTAVSAQTSTLFQTLNTVAPPNVWQTEILRAFQTWAVNARINIGLVGDNGLPSGTPGALQGDTRFGDIRVAAHPVNGHLGTASPFSVLGGTAAGDLTLNSTTTFGIGNPSSYDLYSVVLHEAGHVFGLDHSDDPASPMYESYNGIRTSLTTADITALQAMYGPRLADPYEGPNGNGTIATATSMTGPMVADVTTLQDVDTYRFTTPTGVTSFTVTLQAAGRSLLVGQLGVYNAAGQLVSSATASGPLANNVTLTVSGVAPGATYYFKVQSGSQEVFGIGGYQLSTSTTGAAPSKILDDSHSNDTLAAATNIVPTISQADQRSDNFVYGRLRDPGDVDFYKITAPATQPGQAMVVSAWGLDGALSPRVKVYDGAGNLVASTVLTSEQGVQAVQIMNPLGNAVYYVQVLASTPGSNVGNYSMGVDFRLTPEVMQSSGGDTLGAGDLQDWRTLQVNQDQTFHFTLDSGDVSGACVTMTVYDKRNNVVFTLTSKNGEAVSGNVFLAAGGYTVRFEAGNQNGPVPTLGYDLFASTLTKALAPPPVDPLGDPSGPGAGYQWFFNDDAFYSYLDALDPYSNPWLGY